MLVVSMDGGEEEGGGTLKSMLGVSSRESESMILVCARPFFSCIFFRERLLF